MARKLSKATKIVTVSHRIGERPWRSSCQPSLFETFWQVVENNSYSYS